MTEMNINSEAILDANVENHLSEASSLDALAETAFGPSSSTDRTGQRSAEVDALNEQELKSEAESLKDRKKFNIEDAVKRNGRKAYEKLVELIASQVEKPEFYAGASAVMEDDEARYLAEQATDYTKHDVTGTVEDALESAGYHYEYDNTCNFEAFVLNNSKYTTAGFAY